MANVMFDMEEVNNTPHNNIMSSLTDILCQRTGNINRDFFQAEVAYFLGLIPSALRVSINSPERGNIPINIYSIALATSGFGKGYSVNVMEDIIQGFRERFTQDVFPEITNNSLFQLAVNIAVSKGTNENEELDTLNKDFKRQGHTPFIFDSGTSPAVKQLRYKLLLAKAGSINFQMDEIGSNLVNNSEVLNVLLELYDLGRIKTKLTKNTQDNERGLDLVGNTPANMLMFGTTSKLFDGSKTEEEFFSFLETGYARRCFFGIGKPEKLSTEISPETIYNSIIQKNQAQLLKHWNTRLMRFADIKYHNKELQLPKEVSVKLIAYRLFCEKLANDMPEHEVIKKAEMSHRYFKALKLAGVYAFLDDKHEIEKEHLLQAIKFTENSGDNFHNLLKRERNFIRLAKYISSIGSKLTHADLVEDLPYYPASSTPRKEIMDLAMAWGVSNHVIIKRDLISGIEFFSGSALEKTNLNKMMFSFSNHFAQNYNNEVQPWTNLPKLLSADGYHWANHYFKDNYRLEDNALEGFNILAVDIDGGISLDVCHELLKDYTFITATTKRHTEENNRFRLLMPSNYMLYLDKDDYREFMDNFLLWLPFESDPCSNQRSRKWETNPKAIIKENFGTKTIDVFPFIPKTKKNTEYVKNIADLGNLHNLERWFINNMSLGNRNNNLLKYAFMLADTGLSYTELCKKVHELNESLSSPLRREEVEATVLKSVAQKINSNNIKEQ